MKIWNKIVATGIGKNIPICEKFIATLNSFGINAIYLNPVAAFHGDIGVIGKNDIVILVTKSGETSELCNLYNVLKKRNCPMWLLTFNKKSSLSLKIENSLVILLEHEGDMWNIVPNNSTVISLIILQELALSIAKSLNINVSTFKENHPGGYIGGNIINE